MVGPQENPRAYVSRVLLVWKNIMGNDPDQNQMEQSILRTKLQKGLPLQVRSKLAEVVGLGSMTKSAYIDRIAYQVEFFRKKEQDLKDQDQEPLRKLTQIQLADNEKNGKNQAVVVQGLPDSPPEQQLVQFYRSNLC